MDIASLLDATIRAQGIPISGVSIGSDADHTTWAVHYDPAATDAQKVSGEAIRQAFNPIATSVVAAQVARDATAAVNATIAKAMCALVLDTKLNRALTVADIPAVQALFAKTVTYYQFIVANNL